MLMHEKNMYGLYNFQIFKALAHAYTWVYIIFKAPVILRNI